MVTLKYLLILKMSRKHITSEGHKANVPSLFGSRRAKTKIIGGENCSDINHSQYVKLQVAPLWECGCGGLFFLNLFPSEIFLSEEQAMSSFYGLQLLL